jgi:hypothetical protein
MGGGTEEIRMTDQPGGCACCGGAFDGFFNTWNAAHRAPPPVAPSVGRRAFMAGSVAATALAASLPAGAVLAQPGVTVFVGGTILTVDRGFGEAAALAIRGNRIIAVGSETDVRAAAGAGAKVVDLAGKVMLPGFIDPHTHVVAGGNAAG